MPTCAGADNSPHPPPPIFSRGSTEAQVRELDIEHPNLLAALRWALTDDRHPDDAAGLAHDLIDYWNTIDAAREVTELIVRILDRPDPPTVERVELTLTAAHRRAKMGDYHSAAEYVHRAVDMCRQLQAPRVLADCLLNEALRHRRRRCGRLHP